MSERISSRSTYFYWYVFPVIWLGVWSYGTGRLWFAPDSVRVGGAPGNSQPELKWIFAVAGLAGVTLLIWWVLRVKMIDLTDTELIVKGLLSTTRIPLSAVESVERDMTTRPAMVKITFAADSDVGRVVHFLPRSMAARSLGDATLVDELRRRILSRARSTRGLSA